MRLFLRTGKIFIDKIGRLAVRDFRSKSKYLAQGWIWWCSSDGWDNGFSNLDSVVDKNLRAHGLIIYLF